MKENTPNGYFVVAKHKDHVS